MNPADILTLLRADMRTAADPAHREGSRAFFKEAINPLGVRGKELNAIIARHWRAVRGLEPGELLELCDKLWSSGVFEEPVVASKWCGRALPRLGVDAFSTFERWLATRVDNWAHCDVLCTQCQGGVLTLDPRLLTSTEPWLTSPNRWLRRGAAVSLVPPARNGLFLDAVFRTAEALLEDEDDLVRKGYGWMLKEASKPWPREAFEFVLLRRGRMPRVALRYAIEHFPKDWRAKAMAKP
jgi:3-methyladenine DNA glycosylase AlkD